MDQEAKRIIEAGNGILGIEFGSTRIKAVLIDEKHEPIAGGSHAWENRLENGVWTYHLSDVWEGIQDAYADLVRDVREKYGVTLKKVAGIGISAMMHGYLPFDAEGNQLAEFRTWRNAITGPAAEKLTEAFAFNVPQRWTIAHLYQAILNGEAHVGQIDYLTTLAGYVHWKLTGRRVVGTGEGSGIFPLKDDTGTYDPARVAQFDQLIKPCGFKWKLTDILPEVIPAGADAGCLTEEGARLLDPTGELEAGAKMAPPEGDAGTGMVATNSITPGTGNISAGTSVFAMIVLDHELSRVHVEIDNVATPDGKPVAMVHCNNCTSDINAYAEMLSGFAAAAGAKVSMNQVYEAIFGAALQGEADCGGVIHVNYFSGETITGLDEGRPMLVRLPDARFTFANMARSLLYGAVATLKLGMDILTEEEKVRIVSLLGHGGFFKTGTSGQQLMAAALNTPVSVMKTAGEGGPWGMAVLTAYAVRREKGETLGDYLKNRVFAGAEGSTIEPKAEDVAGFNAYIRQFKAVLPAEKAAVSGLTENK